MSRLVRTILGLAVVACASTVPALPSRAAETITLTLKDHRFTPDQVTVTAGERFQIEVTNLDATPSEFESSDLRVEKIVVAGGKVSLKAGPLKPGIYKFFDDYHPDTAAGTLTAVERKN